MGQAIIIGGGLCSAGLLFWAYLYLKPEVFWTLTLVLAFGWLVGV